MQKSICIITDQRGLYDDRHYWKQALSLKNAGYRVYYLVINSYIQDKGITNEGIEYYHIKREKYLKNRYLNYILKKITPLSNEYDIAFALCKSIRADVYQIVDLRVNRIAKRLKNLSHLPKLIYDIQEPRDYNLLDITMTKWPLPFFLKFIYAKHIQKWEYEKAELYDCIIGTDDAIKDRVKTNLPHKLFYIIYNFTDLTNQRQHLCKDEKVYDAIYTGGISETRGALIIAKATKILKDNFPKIKILLLGKIYEKSLQEKLSNFIKVNNLEENFLLIDYVPYSTISNYLNRSKIGLNPLKKTKAHEGIMQIKLYEYMNFGLPIITSDFGYMQKIVTDTDTGICISPDNPQKLAEAIKYLLNNYNEIERLGKNGIKVVDEKFNWQIMESKYLQIVKNLCN